MIFLTEEEVAELTGIRRGHGGKSRAQLQCDHLKSQGIPFFKNVSGDPKVARSFIEGRASEAPAKKSGWTPAVLQRAA